MGVVTGARVLGEFGDDPHRYADAKCRKSYASTSPITRAPGKKKIVAARFARNDRLPDALRAQAFAAPHASPGARACYDFRSRGIDHEDALRRLAQPAHRHPARLPENPHPLQRSHRLASPGNAPAPRSSLTFKLLGCLPSRG